MFPLKTKWSAVHNGWKYLTRQLPMGAGYCQWGGLTERNQAPRSIGCGRRARDTRKEGKLGNI